MIGLVNKFKTVCHNNLHAFRNIDFKKSLISCKNNAYRLRVREIKSNIIFLLFIMGAFFYAMYYNIITQSPFSMVIFISSILSILILMSVYQKMLTKWIYNVWITRFYICLRICVILILCYFFIVSCLEDEVANNDVAINEVAINYVVMCFGLMLLCCVFYTIASFFHKSLKNKKFQVYQDKIISKISSYLIVQLSIELATFLTFVCLPFICILLLSLSNLKDYSLLINIGIVIWTLLCLILIIPREKNSDIDITFLNLDVFEIFQSDLFINQYWFGNKDCRIFKIDFQSLFEKVFCKFASDGEYSITFLDHFCMPARIKQEQNHTFAFFCMNNIHELTTVKLNVLLTNKGQYKRCNKKYNKYVKLNLIIQFNKIGDEIIMQKYDIQNLHKVFIAFNNSKKKVRDDKCKKFNYLTNMYQYNEGLKINLKNNEFNKITSDRRKFVMHDGAFGCGKTSLDTLLLSNYNYYPVVVSPWEDNYDNDILFLIFQQLMKTCNNKLTLPTTSVIFFFMAAIFSLTALFVKFYEVLVELIVEYNMTFKFYNLTLELNFFIDRSNITTIFIYTFLIFISAVISSILLPYIIIHVKDSSKVHQKYYINKISSILRKGKQVLVIEDIDRLEPEIAKNVFRIISSINKGCASSQRIIGMISLNKSLFAKDKNGNYRLGDKNLLDDLENKVIKKEVFDDYEEKESKIKYFTECILAIIGDYLWKEKNYSSLPWNKAFVNYVISQVYPKTFSSIKSIKFKRDNFRKIHEHLETLRNYVENNELIDDNDFNQLFMEIKIKKG